MNRQCLLFVLLYMSACTREAPSALGTLEYDLVRVPAPVFERIASMPVSEGQMVAAGDTLLVLESTRVNADVAAARAEVDRLQSLLDEARRGPRRESVLAAQAQLEGATGVLRNADSDLLRIQELVTKQLLSKAELDRAQSARTVAQSNVRAARESLLLLQRGTRSEQIAQARAALAVARAKVEHVKVDADRTRIAAPRAGRVDSLPFEVGDQVQAGTTLATLLVGDRPYARVYVPQVLRASISIGSAATITLLDGKNLHGIVRNIRSEPSFTPYYALSGKDASRQSWLAEIQLQETAVNLPAGMPVRATFATGTQ
jgi:HlyD family secretion protein